MCGKSKSSGVYFFAALVAGHRQGADGIAVKALPAGNHPIFAGFTVPLQIVLTGHFQGRLGCLRTAGHQVQLVQRSGRQAAHQVGQPPRRLGRPARQVTEGDFLGLFGHSGERPRMGVAEVGDGRARRSVDIAVALAVEEIYAVPVSHFKVVLLDIPVKNVVHD
jgi:hypothetical protein